MEWLVWAIELLHSGCERTDGKGMIGTWGQGMGIKFKGFFGYLFII